MFRAYPRSEIARPFRGYADYERTIDKIVTGAEIADYTFLWWDVRPHPRLGTVEVRAMDAQADLDTVAALTALIHGLALHELSSPRPADDSGVLEESSFRAGPRRPPRDDLVRRRAARRARGRREGGPPGPPPRRRARARAHRPHRREGNGADRQRAAHARGGWPALEHLVTPALRRLAIDSMRSPSGSSRRSTASGIGVRRQPWRGYVGTDL
jgi:carboxylate-amine ligase